MSLETGTYPTFVGGASQQDDTVRSPSQLHDAVNAWLHAAMGSGKRPPATFIQVLRSDLDHYSHFHSIVRDSAERYIVVVGHRSVRVFDHETGKEYTVIVTGDALDYLECTGQQAWTVFRTLTIADSTFIANRTVTVEMDAELAPGVITVGVQNLEDAITNQSIIANGALIHVVGTNENPFDDYYIQKSGASTFTEIAKPGITHKYDSTTMPHVLKRIPDDTKPDGFFFSFGAPEWDERPSGDDQSNPPASFVGQTIQEMFLHRDRLGFLAAESVIMSETGRYFSLWRTSVTQVLDSDPIDVAIPTSGVASLMHAVPFQSSLFLGGDRAQFLLTAEPYLAARYVKCDPITNYDMSKYLRPQMLGDSLYWGSGEPAWLCLREYFMDDLSITGDAGDVTGHVPRYIPGETRSMATSSNADMVFIAPTTGDSQLYVYSVRWSGDEKKQSAWSRWNISGVGAVLHAHVIGDKLYLCAESQGGGVELLCINLALNTDDSDATGDYEFLLDRLTLVTGDYFAFGNYTDFNLPFALANLSAVTAVKTDDWEDPGAYFELTGASLQNGGTTIRMPGRHDTGRIAVGLDYECRLSLSKPALRDSSQNTILVGRTQVRDIEVAYNNAAYFECEVEAKGTGHKETYLASSSTSYNARTLGDDVFVLSGPTFHSGSRRFPVQSNADNVRIHLVNRLPFQCWWLSAQWRGLFTSRSRV